MIFNTFDPSNRTKINIENLPKILRLLNYNIGKLELDDLSLIVDPKQKGFFSMDELKNLLQNFKFTLDKQRDLVAAF